MADAPDAPAFTAEAAEPLALPARPRRRGLAFWSGVVLALGLHGGLVAVALFGDRVPDFSREEQAIPVEIVREMPKPPETPRLYWPEPPKELAKPEVKPEQKAEPAKEQPKPEPPKDQPKQEQPKPAEQAKPDPQKPEPPKAEPPKPAPEKAEPLKQAAPPPPPQAPKPQPAPQQPAPPPQPAAKAANAPADAPAQAGAVGGTNARGNGQTPEALRSAYIEPPRPALTRKEDIYLPLSSTPLPPSFRDRALTTDGQKEVDDYKAQVFALLEAAKPPTGETLPGQVIVGFTIDLDGKLVSASVVRSSGDPALEAQALDTVRRAAPFPLPPPESPRVFAAAILFAAE